MSVAEIKSELQGLSRAERLSLEEYLKILNHLDDPAVRERVNAAMKRMDAGQKVSQEEVMAAHERLLAEGR